MLCLSCFELYSRWVLLEVQQNKLKEAQEKEKNEKTERMKQ